MSTIIHSIITRLIEAYKADFEHNIRDEIYKWKAVKCFQDSWDIDASDFAGMLKQSLAKTKNLLAFNSNYPRRMIQMYASVHPEKVRSLFRVLFDENLELSSRIADFKAGIERIHKEWDRSQDRNHYHTLTVISIYLWLRFPDRYYIYKPTVAQKVFDELGIDEHLLRRGIPAMMHAYAVYDMISERLVDDSMLRWMLDDALSPDCYPDYKMKTLTADMCYCLSRRQFSMARQKAVANRYLKSQIAQGPELDPLPQKPVSPGYWWLNANPRIWSMAEWIVGQKQEYTLYNANGHKRRIFQNFIDAKEGDCVICYESNPTKQILGLACVSRKSDGHTIEFVKTETFTSPIDYATIKDVAELQNMEFLTNSNGSFFKLTGDEYGMIMDIVRDANRDPSEQTDVEPYTETDFCREVFLSDESRQDLERLIRLKKNVILEGAPGVGKTYVAKRMAYMMMGKKDDARICCVQFHQNYSYEDFVMGYKPCGDKFILKKGVFYDFCTLAKNDPGREYYFIIDEINRGNLSKIFGELLMLIENGYRGETLTLPYSGERFHVPENIYIIGLMNTADRSLAMIDYALRRRFSFFGMKPGFDSAGFQKYQNAIGNRKFDRLINVIKKLNEAIVADDSLGVGFEIGHSYFCGQTEVTDDWLRSVVHYDIIPMLKEYWFDSRRKVEEWSNELNAALDD